MSKKMWKKLSTLLLMVVMVLTMSLSVQAAAVKMNKAKATLYPGQKVTLKVTGTSKKAKWSSSNAKVAKVSKVILSILVDTFISKISLTMQPGPKIDSISGA